MTKGYGLSVEDINGSSPSDLSPYTRAYKLALQEKDSYVWAVYGTYGKGALSSVLDSAFNGRKANSKYPEKPLMDSEVTSETPDTEDERQKLLDEWVRQRKIDKMNFDLMQIRKKKELEQNGLA